MSHSYDVELHPNATREGAERRASRLKRDIEKLGGSVTDTYIMRGGHIVLARIHIDSEYESTVRRFAYVASVRRPPKPDLEPLSPD